MKSLLLPKQLKQFVTDLLKENGYEPSRDFVDGKKQYRVRSTNKGMYLYINDKEPLNVYASVLMQTLTNYFGPDNARLEQENAKLNSVVSEMEVAQERWHEAYENRIDKMQTMLDKADKTVIELTASLKAVQELQMNTDAAIDAAIEKTSTWVGKRGKQFREILQELKDELS